MKNSKEEQKQHLIDIMRGDEELGLYDEPKQQTIKEFIESEGYPEGPTQEIWKQGVLDGLKWQAARMYSEADKMMKFLDTEIKLGLSDIKTIERVKWYFETYFEQFKKK